MTDIQTAQAMDRAAMLLKLAAQYIRDLPFDVVTDAGLMHYDGELVTGFVSLMTATPSHLIWN